MTMTDTTAAELIARSDRLGADPNDTNYAGGNTSAKGTATDPVRGEPVELLWVKGKDDRAGLLDGDALAAAQSQGDVRLANEIFMDAFYTDVRSDLADWRESRGRPADPMRAYLASGYQDTIEADRLGGAQAGWN